jgi:hypothetical protein
MYERFAAREFCLRASLYQALQQLRTSLMHAMSIIFTVHYCYHLSSPSAGLHFHYCLHCHTCDYSRSLALPRLSVLLPSHSLSHLPALFCLRSPVHSSSLANIFTFFLHTISHMKRCIPILHIPNHISVCFLNHSDPRTASCSS